MNRFPNDEMADMQFVYGEAEGNSREAARIYAVRFPNRIVPDPRTFTAIHRRLRETGSLMPVQHDRGREWMEPGRQQEIVEYVNEHPDASGRSVAAALGIGTHVTVWRVLRRHNLHPFHYQRVQGSTPVDHLPRVQFSR